jgi:hypothetical protein
VELKSFIEETLLIFSSERIRLVIQFIFADISGIQDDPVPQGRRLFLVDREIEYGVLRVKNASAQGICSK